MSFLILILFVLPLMHGCAGQDLIYSQVAQGFADKFYDEVGKRLKQPSLIDLHTVECSKFNVGETFKLNNFDYLVVDNDTAREEANLQKLADGVLRFCTTHMYDMRELFQHQADFNADISDWDTRAVLYFNNMFEGATKFNQNIRYWSVEEALDFSYMFAQSDSFNKQIINFWNFKEQLTLASFNCMFSDATGSSDDDFFNSLVKRLGFKQQDFLDALQCR